MRGILNIRMLSVRAALLAVLVGGLVIPGALAQSAKQNQKSDKQTSGSSQAQAPIAGGKAGEEESAPANKEHAGGPQEGIKVHGHWVIDVRNPDGKLVTHREFENSYLSTQFLSLTLARQYSVGFWRVLLSDPDYQRFYSLLEPSFTGPGDSKNLTLSSSSSGFLLSGSFTALTSDNISFVETDQTACGPSNPPSTPCQSGSTYQFTQTLVNPPVGFVSGQTVQVTVTISFS